MDRAGNTGEGLERKEEEWIGISVVRTRNHFVSLRFTGVLV